jgi:hypothetical protein
MAGITIKSDARAKDCNPKSIPEPKKQETSQAKKKIKRKTERYKNIVHLVRCPSNFNNAICCCCLANIVETAIKILVVANINVTIKTRIINLLNSVTTDAT